MRSVRVIYRIRKETAAMYDRRHRLRIRRSGNTLNHEQTSATEQADVSP